MIAHRNSRLAAPMLAPMLVLMLALVPGAATIAQATVIVPMDLGELSREAGAIVRGRVVAIDSRWTDDRRGPPTGTDLHGAWIDPAGRAWAVGGNFNQPGATARTGAVGVDGCPRPDSL